MSCPSIQGVRPMVKRTGLGSLCLSERGGIPRMCVGAVLREENSGNFQEISLIKPIKP